MHKAIERRVDNLLNQSPKALARMASQITDDILENLEKGGTEEDGLAAMTEFLTKYVKPMDTRTYLNYTLEYSMMREHYWMRRWLKAEMRFAESHRNHLSALRLIIMGTMLVEGQIDHTDPICADMIKEAGTAAPGDIEDIDLREVFDLVTAELEKAETTVREWHEADVWQLIGHKPPVADA